MAKERKQNFTCEREFWDYYRKPRCTRRRQKLDENFKKLFRGGHKHTLRLLLGGYLAIRLKKKPKRVEHFSRWLDEIHPRAVKLLIDHGRDYVPCTWQERPQMEPKWGKCYYNARLLMVGKNQGKANRRGKGMPDYRPRLTYVEGVVFGVFAPTPMLHAWNAFGHRGKAAFDWSHYAGCHWSRYLGISLSEDEYRIAVRMVFPKKDYAGGLLTRERFPKVEKYLRNILSRRKHQTRKGKRGR